MTQAVVYLSLCYLCIGTKRYVVESQRWYR